MLGPYFGFRGLYDDFGASYGPQVQAHESATGLCVELDVPRYRMADLTLDTDLDRGVLTVTGSRNATAAPSAGGASYDVALVVSSPLGGFRRSFHLSPSIYDLTKITTSLDAGVLSILVPKVPPKPAEQPLTIFGSDAAVAKTTAEELQAVRRAKDIMSVKKEETAAALTYRCELSPVVTKDHIELTLTGRTLQISVRYVRTVKTDRSESHESATYATNVAVPAGTTAADVHTTYEPGLLVVTLDKHAAAAAPAAISVKQGA